MRLLITTQAVDVDDPVLGFFHAIIEGLAKHFERVEVICLKEGRHTLPANVRVHSLGKPSSAKATKGTGARFVSRVRYTSRFLWLAWRLRREYDRVFVHMNEEYVLIAGWLWKLRGARLVLWRNHKMGTWRTRLAASLAAKVCYTSPGAFVASRANAVQMPVGIDTGLFHPPTEPPAADTILFLGRLDPVKKVEVFIAALHELAKSGVAFRAVCYGDPTIPGDPYAAEITRSAADLVATGSLTFHKGVANSETPHLYGAHAIYVNTTPSGSFDKTIGEAMACGALVVCTNEAVREALGDELMALDDDTKGVARALEHALGLSVGERAAKSRELRAYVEAHHSLASLIKGLATLLQ